jgi:uncharacterized protein DUF3310
MPALSPSDVGPFWCPDCKTSRRQTCRCIAAETIAIKRESASLRDHINHPEHYERLKPEPIDIIDSWALGFYPAQILKYIARAGHKGPKIEDLKKAQYYINRWIQKEESK